MRFFLNDQGFIYELEKLSRLFLPFEKFEVVNSIEEARECEQYIAVLADYSKEEAVLVTELKLDSKFETRRRVVPNSEVKDKGTYELVMALMLFECFESITGYRTPWGILTGIRPAKLMGKMIASMGEEAAIEYFKENFLVSSEKTKLCYDCFKSEEDIIKRSTSDSFSLYVSIPFCPSRCNYCSFVSHSVEQAKKLIPKYVEFLCEEIKETAEIANSLKLKLLTIYIGGGTPTTLSAEQLTMIMDTVKSNFDFTYLEEYTVEAGRPDTVTEEKLVAIKEGGATRISINPQTMNDDVLKNIGRRHSAKDMIDAFNLARKCGFDNINTDLIAGLSGDTYESFCSSVDEIIALKPENVTVHTLSMKRASNLTKSCTVFESEQGKLAEAMVTYSYNKLSEAGIKPYYMYRQSKTVGNLENVGYAKEGYEGLYNVYIMDETHTILACGASSVTKLREPDGPYIERVFNFKYPYEYIERFDIILGRKQQITEFYEQFGSK